MMVLLLWLWCRTRHGSRDIHNACFWRWKLNPITVTEIAAQTESQGGQLLAIRRMRALQRLTNAHIPADLSKRGQYLCLNICRRIRQELEQLLTKS